jgi:VWFA-related protein
MDHRNCRRMLAVPLLAGAALVAAPSVDPQEVRLAAFPYFPKPAITLKAEARLVDIGVVVRDSQGHSVRGLSKSDFEIRDEGKWREITAFSVQSFTPAGTAPERAPDARDAVPTLAPPHEPQPRWVAMVFDDVDMPWEDLTHVKAAAKRFLTDGMAADDRVGVLTVSSGVVLPFTADTAKIADAIDKVSSREHKIRSEGCPLLTEYDAFQIANNNNLTTLDIKAEELTNCQKGVCPPPPPVRIRHINGTTSCDQAVQAVQRMAHAVWDQVREQSRITILTLENIVDSMSRLNGTRVMLLASSGFLSGGLEFDQDQIVEKALRANVMINSLDAKGLYTIDAPELGMGATSRSVTYQQSLAAQPKEDLNAAMGNLADSTGGLFFHNSNDLDRGFKDLGMQPEVSYLLGFAPEVMDSKYHRLKVSLTAAHHTTVQARRGYVATAGRPGEPKPPAERRMDKEVFTASLLEEAPVTVVVSPGKSPEGHPMAELTFHVNIGKVQFHDQDGVRVQRFRIIAVLLDAQGRFVKGLEGVMEFALKQASYERILATGFNTNLSLEAPAGSYRPRTVVVEGNENGPYSTATQPAEIR